MFPTGERSDLIERWDVQAHLDGKPDAENLWEMLTLPPEHFRLIQCPLFAPISDTEIAFLR